MKQSVAARIVLIACAWPMLLGMAQSSPDELLATVRETLWPELPHQFEAFAVRADDWDTNGARSTPPRVPGERLLHRVATDGRIYVNQETFLRQQDGSIAHGIGKQMGWNGEQAVFTQTDPSLLASGLAQIVGFDEGRVDGYRSLAGLTPSMVFSGLSRNYGQTIADLAESAEWREDSGADGGVRVLTTQADGGTVRLLFRDGRLFGWDVIHGEGDVYDGETLPVRTGDDAEGEYIFMGRQIEVRFGEYKKTKLGPTLPMGATVQFTYLSNRGQSTSGWYVWRRDVEPLTGELDKELFTPTGITKGQFVRRNRPPTSEPGAIPPPVLVWYDGGVVEDDGQLLADQVDDAVVAERGRRATTLAAAGWGWKMWTVSALSAVVVVLLAAVLVAKSRRGRARGA